MNLFRASVVVLALSSVSAGVRAQPVATAPTSGPAAGLQRIRSLMDIPRGTDQSVVHARLREIFPALEEMEKKYPKATELHEARAFGVMVAGYLGRAAGDGSMLATAKAIAGRLLSSEAPTTWKIRVDAQVLMMQLDPGGAASRPSAAHSEKLIRDFARRYVKTDGAATAYLVGAQLARRVRNTKLQEEFEQVLLKEYSDDPEARIVLRQMGKDPDRGKPFKATLTKLDGSKLELPGDLLGKVVVVDFWAMWCGPCIGEIPHMKRTYAAYREKGVEFVGISLDRAGEKAKLAAFVGEQKMNWVHTYSGKYWDDPTAREYAVDGIPSIWVVGKDGKVVTSNARGNLEASIEKALLAPTTRPATRPAPGEG